MSKQVDILDKVEKKYGNILAPWVAEKGKVHETRMINELARELKNARNRIQNLEDSDNVRWREAAHKERVARETINNLRRTVESMRGVLGRTISAAQCELSNADKVINDAKIRENSL